MKWPVRNIGLTRLLEAAESRAGIIHQLQDQHQGGVNDNYPPHPGGLGQYRSQNKQRYQQVYESMFEYEHCRGYKKVTLKM